MPTPYHSETFNKIQDLLKSGQKENIDLALMLAVGANISEAALVEPWKELIDFINLDENYDINPERDGLAAAFNFLNISELNFYNKGISSIPQTLVHLKQLTTLDFDGNSLTTLSE